jgi:DNA-binding MarR family transcriptional regulator
MHAECLIDLDITPTQFSLMTCLVYLHQSGPVTASRIVAHTGMDKMMVSDLLKTLKKKRLVTRSKNPADGRSHIVAPTPLGEKTTNAAVLKIEALDTRFFSKVKNPSVFHQDLVDLVAQNF